MPIKKPFVPTCRYEHGPLGRVDNKGKTTEWAVLAGDNLSFQGQIVGFFMELYVCETCGYSEFFDSDPEKTHRETVSK